MSYGKKLLLSELYVRKTDEKVMDRYFLMAEKSKTSAELASSEWFVENYNQMKMLFKSIRSSAKRISHHIPTVKEGVLRGYPRIFALVMEFIDNNPGIIDEEEIISFIQTKEKEEILTLDELWAMQTVFYLVLTKNILTVASRRLEDLKKTEKAIDSAKNDKIMNYELSDVAPMDNITALAAFIREIEKNDDIGDKVVWLDKGLRKNETAPRDVKEMADKIEANSAVAVRNMISCLMRIGQLDWEKIISDTSEVDKILSDDADGTYPVMDTETKNLYRRKIARLAVKMKKSETETAKSVVESSKKTGEHIGVVMFGRKGKGVFGKIAYFTALFALTVAILLANEAILRMFDTKPLLTAVLLFLSVIPSKNAAQTVANYLATLIVSPTVFPRLELNGKIPPEMKTAVVMPSIITNTDEAKRLILNLEANYIANKCENIYFVLLGDFTDADCERKADDLAVFEQTVAEINRLNEKYSKKVFFYMGRKRVYNRTHRRYFGWERKRGAIMSFNKFLRTGEKSDFIYSSGGEEILVGAKYLITVDSDTRMTFSSASKLVAAISHPLNRPVYRAEGAVVISGYGLLQPMMTTTLDSAAKSIFTRAISGFAGVEPYSSRTSEVYQDVFGEGNFGGKGIIDSETFYNVLEKRLPENTILSHDLLEGCHVRAGFVSDIVFADDVPTGYASFRKRIHRWMRGDWQLFRFLLPFYKNENGNFTENRLSFISKFKIADNMAKTAAEPIIFLLIFAGLFDKGIQSLAIWFILLMLLIPFVIDSFEKMKTELATGAKRRTDKLLPVREAGKIMLLADRAFLNADAAVRSLARLYTGKNLLEWQTAGQTEARAKNDIRSYYYMMRSSALSGVLLAVLSAVLSNPITAFFGLLFAVAPAIISYCSKQNTVKPLNLSCEQENAVETAAKGAWDYFSELCTEENNFLPPDNYQQEPYKGIAVRTSPTNIGMMLAGTVAAEKLGFTSPEHVIDLTSKTLKTVLKLEKHNGQPYNWYDIKTLKPLTPKFISTADNGNLACSLITLREALSRYVPTVSEEKKRIISDSLQIIAGLLKNMDFGMLYDENRELLSVGFDCEDGRLSPYYYDIFASEARLSSFYAVISGNVPSKHWERLSRIVTLADNRIHLKSWNGSMFEYFMPQLFFGTYKGSLFEEAGRVIIREQMRYGRKAGEPWGVSESGYSVFDGDKNYQYRAFGIPSVAVRHIKTDEYVVAPYATALALMLEPEKASKNLVRLAEKDMLGRFGYYEALDVGRGSMSVKSFMAHHEGMTLISAANCMTDNSIVKLFHSAPEVKAGELMLQEKTPSVIQYEVIPKRVSEKNPQIEAGKEIVSRTKTGAYPHSTVLTNTEMSAFLSDNGEIKLFSGNTLINNNSGQTFFITDEETGRTVPLFGKGVIETEFRADKAVFRGKNAFAEFTVEIELAYDKRCAFFNVDIRNPKQKTKELSVICYLEPALDDERAILAHRAYSDMFIMCEYNEKERTATAQRRSRLDCRRKAFLSLTALSDNTKACLSRFNFIGRNGNIKLPRADFNSETYSKTEQILALKTKITLSQGESKQCGFIVCCENNENELWNCIHCYSEKKNRYLSYDLQYEQTKLRLQCRQIDRTSFEMANAVISRLFYPHLFRKRISYLQKENLWKYGISGDYPIIFYDMTGNNDTGIKLTLILYGYILSCGVKADFVVLSHDDGYHRYVYEDAVNIVRMSSERDMLSRGNGIFILQAEKLRAEAKEIEAFASVCLKGNKNDITARLLSENGNITHLQNGIHFLSARKGKSVPLDVPHTVFFNGYGGFCDDEYVILLDKTKKTPKPWSHVMSNEKFGTLVTESGGGYTWFRNSRENKLSGWSNDAVCDAPSEMIYIKDNNTKNVFSPVRNTDGEGQYIVKYGLGYAEYIHGENDIIADNVIFVPKNECFKANLLRLENLSGETKKITVCFYTSVLLSSGEKNDIEIRNERARGIIMAKNASAPKNGIAYVATGGSITSVITKKSEFFGNGSMYPAALDYREWRVNQTGGIADCLAVSVNIELEPNSEQSAVFLFGCAESTDEIYKIRNEYCREEPVNRLLFQTKEYYGIFKEKIRIMTCDKMLDTLFNSFLMYQTYVCRYLARTSFYQCSGAYGFRDQLQDTLAFVYCEPKEARKHILRAAGQQFEAGDVRHWWHDDSNVGIRTRISDDLMFLPYVAAEYAEITDDWEIFDELCPYSTGQSIEDGKETAFGKTYFTEKKDTLYEHCRRACHTAMRFGEHGLPLIGTGDWNDGFDRVGNKGKGESVWLAFFFTFVMEKFKKLAEKRNDFSEVCYSEKIIAMLKKGISDSGWDGGWFRRAYCDDGTPIGSKSSDQCKIDLLVQSWATISGATDEIKSNTSLDSAEKMLVDEKNGIVKLFSPPFDEPEKDIGYTTAYKSGVRENGGQYTHAALWFALALSKAGRNEEAYDIIKMINPVERTATATGAEKYMVEPYVVAADIYTNGEGGWTWYTGSSGWMYKIILESILGVRISGNKLLVEPTASSRLIPYRVTYNKEDNGIVTPYIIDVLTTEKERSITVDDAPVADDTVILADDGKMHKIVIGRGSHSQA